MEDTVCIEGSELLPNLEDDLLDAEVSALFHNYLQMSEMNMRDSGIRLDSSDCSSTSSSLLPLTPLERLIRTHPIWFLPEVDKEGATNILHSKETGNFLVRRSTHSKTALSVKLGPQHGFMVDHIFLKEDRGKVSLTSSCLEFDTILSLVYHYTSHSGDLPVQLSLPSILRQTEGRQCLSSLALLGRDFWRYPMSNPGRQSLMLLNLTERSVQPESKSEISSKPQQDMNRSQRPPQRSSVRSRSASCSPTQSKKKIEFSVLNVAPTLSPKLRQTVLKMSQKREGQDLVSEDSSTARDIKLKIHNDSIYYFKSPTNDKMSDYEDIWEKTPGPESPNHPLCDGIISPTLSEKKFKQFLFTRFFDKNYSAQPETKEIVTNNEESEDFNYAESLPSYPSCSSSYSNRSSSLSSDSMDSSDIHSDTSEYSDPLEVLEKLTDTVIEDTNIDSEEEDFWCSYSNTGKDDTVLVDKDTNCVETAVKKNEQLHFNIETSHSLCDLPTNFINHDDGQVQQSKGSIGGLLRKLSIKRKSSITKSTSKQEKRLSAVIGCYLTPSSLGRKDDDGCQVDSSSWEFLDQNKEPSMEYFKEIKTQVEINSQSIEILPPCKMNIEQHKTPNEAVNHCDETARDDSTVDSVYHTDQSNDGITEEYSGQPNNGIKLISLTDSDRQDSASSRSIKDYIEELTTKDNSILGQTVSQFITCTKDSPMEDPTLVMQNMRQVMNGLKNYLMITGEGELFQLLKLERAKLSPDQFLDLDTILEEVMHDLIVRPLRKHLELLFIQDFTRSGCIQLLSKNITYALSLSFRDFSIPEEFEPNLISLVEFCRNALLRMREAFSPSDKLNCFLQIINHVLQSASLIMEVSLPRLCSLLCYLIVQTNWDSMEIDCEYMWGLLSPTLLAKEGGYYLSLLSCAVHMLKNIPKLPGHSWLSSSISQSPLLPVTVPDDQTDSLVQWTVPTRPEMTVRDVTRCLQGSTSCKGDCALFSFEEGKETVLRDDLKIHEVLAGSLDRPVVLVFKRKDMKIILPGPTSFK